jgi:quercetin dioxygenase-like cupin family protein
MKKRLFATTVLSFSMFVLALAQSGPTKAPPTGGSEQTMKITRIGSQAPQQGPAEYFTGSVRVEPLFPVSAPSRISSASVTFEPGARSAWHTHPLGQTLIVTAGTGWVQQEGGERQEIKPGDVIWTPPGVKHWHGATATSSVTHLAIQEALDGKVVEWMEKVSEEQYLAKPSRP